MKVLILTIGLLSFTLFPNSTSFNEADIINVIIVKKYGGTASVKVENEKGKQRVINVSVSCNYNTESDAKEWLMKRIESTKTLQEKYINTISYSIDSCEK